jgi:hypothetical protein
LDLFFLLFSSFSSLLFNFFLFFSSYPSHLISSYSSLRCYSGSCFSFPFKFKLFVVLQTWILNTHSWAEEHK